MRKIIRNTCVGVLVVFLGACAAPKTIYYWGDYSETAYDYKHEPSTDSLSQHKAALLDIIENAARKNKKIPPGIYAELAKLELDANNLNGAKQFLKQEEALFPESAIMVRTMLTMIEKMEVNNASTN
ncbi:MULTISPECIES: DUF4810 domain-containing protein [Alteromonadaceae]|uniref:DUF4810 domain-containing protein n=1 Tax=Alteromonadaceae TaxID=72275 RepID=UPI0026E30179|nr:MULTISPECIES: DUF4810 domain-containing protein [unclassified Aliiglaciecola]MDO6712645.1 DUF4810 domain-containing protein [Aliiglaciecola sp. 2_MG-2023]MDO6753747.1 DUF4810 domain-containing protein [Aliiglaciecola sp. 1_MG-2023]